MKVVIFIVKVFLLATITISLSSCGYKPSAKYSRAVTGEKISTSVIISSEDPENTVLIKDSMDSAILEVFHASLTSQKLSTTHLNIAILNISYMPLQYDQDGFVIAYRTTIVLKIDRKSKLREKKYIANGSYDFSIVANAIMSDQQRFDAIRYSSTKAIKSFIAQVSAEGARINKEEE